MNEKITVSPSDINPIDYFNKTCVQYVFARMCALPLGNVTSINSFSYTKNRADEKKQMIVIENEMFVAKFPNELGMNINEPYTPFRMLVEFIFNYGTWDDVKELIKIIGFQELKRVYETITDRQVGNYLPEMLDLMERITTKYAS